MKFVLNNKKVNLIDIMKHLSELKKLKEEQLQKEQDKYLIQLP